MVFRKQSHIDAPVEKVFSWHERPDAFQKLTPPWQTIDIEEMTGGIRDGARVVFRIRKGPLSIRWIAEHQAYVANRQFRDIQIAGPFAKWEHTHTFMPEGTGCLLEDFVEYKLPLGWLGELCGGWLARRELERLFAYRHSVTLRELNLSGDN